MGIWVETILIACVSAVALNLASNGYIAIPRSQIKRLDKSNSWILHIRFVCTGFV